MIRINKYLATVAVAAVGLTQSASATIFAHATSGGTTIGADVSTLLPINSTLTSLPVKLAKAGGAIITYSTECDVFSGTQPGLTYVDIDILVNGTKIAPLQFNDDAFCSSFGSGNQTWSRPSVSAWVALPSGTSQIQVKAILNGGVDSSAQIVRGSIIVTQ